MVSTIRYYSFKDLPCDAEAAGFLTFSHLLGAWFGRFPKLCSSCWLYVCGGGYLGSTSCALSARMVSRTA